jgi:hypothetical protein
MAESEEIQYWYELIVVTRVFVFSLFPCFYLFFLVIQKYILLSSFFENIYKKWDVTKKYKKVLDSVIIEYFVHYQMFLETIISYTNTS